ncbi:MAG TPA: Hpt domain-containing protein [Pirellulales bacterium]|nr:Hpt domain-containing protein [Pirellulales bacterium]
MKCTAEEMIPTAQFDVLYSPLAEDPMLGEIVRCYVAEMPDRIAALLASFESGDRGRLTMLAHQIKGSAGSHGFHQLTSYAAALEQLARGHASDEEIGAAVGALAEACRRVRCR